MMMSRPSSAVDFSAARTRAVSMAPILIHERGVQRERPPDSVLAGLAHRKLEQRARVAVEPKRRACPLQPAVRGAEQAHRPRPGGAVALALLPREAARTGR